MPRESAPIPQASFASPKLVEKKLRNQHSGGANRTEVVIIAWRWWYSMDVVIHHPFDVRNRKRPVTPCTSVAMHIAAEDDLQTMFKS